ncbi:MAG: tRNA dihydrouridine synthase DusB [Candidatus Omnitrophota bacterium]|jgi:tRNA-dihydrouridine synthase B
MLTIGSLQLRHPFILAPMSGVSDQPFRLLNRRFGCELAFVEMINARSLGYKSKKTKRLISTVPLDRPIGVQLLGSEAQYIERGLDILEEYSFDILDFNAACPERKVTRRGEGAALMKAPEKLRDLLKLVKERVRVPVTVKIRAGWDEQSINARDTALHAQDAGIDALFIHGRTKTQLYAGEVDYDVIREVKKSLSIPVIGSGDIFTGLLAKKMFDETGCDGVLVARGSFGNPWIFKELGEYLKKGVIPKAPEREETARVMNEHLAANTAFYGERMGVVIFRKFFTWYVKGFRKTRFLKEKSSHAATPSAMQAIIEEFRSQK